MSFTVRIELHNASEDDYTDLHEAMGREGFSRTITSDSGTTYHLPTAEYDFAGNSTRSDVLARAKRAAGTTRRTAGILVTESSGRSWEGLDPVR